MRERLIELIRSTFMNSERNVGAIFADELADYLLKNGVVVLPCNVGDTCYYIGYLPCHQGETYPSDYNCAGCEDGCDILETVKRTKIPSLTFIVNNFVDHQGMYYLTKEEAEAALERGKQ